MPKVLVLNVSRYKFPNDAGEVVEGSKITFCESPEVGDNNKGMMPMTVNAPLDAYKIFDHVPGIYDIELSHKANAQGKIQVKFGSAKFSKIIEIPQF